MNEIKSIAKKYGYAASDIPPNTQNISGSKKKDWLNAIIITVSILFIYKLLSDIGLLDKLNTRGGQISLGISLIVGFTASLSSCLAVVGSVVIAFFEKYQQENSNFIQSVIKPNIMFHFGRLATFFILGGLLGSIGGEINLSGHFISVYTIIIVIIMAWLGLNILGIAPSIANFGLRMPSHFTKKWDQVRKSEHKAAPLILGGLSFFLPCGFTQSMQLFALTSGSFMTGALSLLLFAIGTLPVLFLVGLSASWTKSRRLIVFQKVAGFLILIFAFFMLNSALALWGTKGNVLTVGKKTESEKAEVERPAENQQIVEMSVTRSGFEPSTLRVKRGIPVKMVVKGVALSGCTNRIILPSLNIEKSLVPGDNIINFTPTSTGTIPFSCWMGMVRGKIIVE